MLAQIPDLKVAALERAPETRCTRNIAKCVPGDFQTSCTMCRHRGALIRTNRCVRGDNPFSFVLLPGLQKTFFARDRRPTVSPVEAFEIAEAVGQPRWRLCYGCDRNQDCPRDARLETCRIHPLGEVGLGALDAGILRIEIACATYHLSPEEQTGHAQMLVKESPVPPSRVPELNMLLS